MITLDTIHPPEEDGRRRPRPRAPRLGTQEYGLYALAYRRISVRPRVIRYGALAGALFWEIQYLGGSGTMWPRFAPTLADAMNVVHATSAARERGRLGGGGHD